MRKSSLYFALLKHRSEKICNYSTLLIKWWEKSHKDLFLNVWSSCKLFFSFSIRLKIISALCSELISSHVMGRLQRFGCVTLMGVKSRHSTLFVYLHNIKSSKASSINQEVIREVTIKIFNRIESLALLHLTLNPVSSISWKTRNWEKDWNIRKENEPLESKREIRKYFTTAFDFFIVTSCYSCLLDDNLAEATWSNRNSIDGNFHPRRKNDKA